MHHGVACCALLVAVVRRASVGVGRVPHEECGPRLLEQLEPALEFVGTLAGLQCKPSITEAKTGAQEHWVCPCGFQVGQAL